ncbi:MAG TPA: tetratricopeptide repeat protein [Steroidobacteraceae bacterium]|jgi:tetratricopeptide (TPR) repeat protein|nr:tetratricopeptide repeat protein [Steroidobacteraceae bacterium]
MGEGLLGGFIGEEHETPEAEPAEAPGGVEAFAAAIAAIASRQDPEVARETSAFLRDQSRLLQVQKKHLEEEHALRLTHLRNQLREERIRRVALRLRVAFQLFIALIATAIVAAILLMLRDALTSRSVVVESFDVPPSLVARGVTGKIVAGGLLDELRRFQSATRGDAAKRDLSNAWTGEIKLAVPEAGVSLGEFSRMLKARFGHDLHIDGELMETEAGGLALTVRGDGVAAKTFSGSSRDLDQLTVNAAGYVYAQSEPVLWAYYLTNRGRNQEAITFSQSAFAGADMSDRPFLLNTWANALAATGKVHESLALYRAALKLKPDYWVAYNNVINALWVLGDEEGAWRAGEEMRRTAGGRPGRASETYYQNVDVLVWNLQAWRDALIADANANGGVGSNVGSDVGIAISDVDIRLHDLVAADIALQTVKPDPADESIPVMSHFLRGRLATEAGDTARAAAEMEAFGALFVNPSVTFNFPGFPCWIAPAEEAAGHVDKADAVLKSAGTFVDCYRFRADILNGRGDWAGAQKAYAEAVALAPDLPASYYSWGLALAARGDLPAAEAKFKDANKRGPHWADPLKAWGDMLASQGHGREAVMKYDEALKFAPNWTALKEARDVAAKSAD